MPLPEEPAHGGGERGTLQARITELEAEVARLGQTRAAMAREREAQLEAAELRFREHKDRALDCEGRLREQEHDSEYRDAEIAALQAKLAAAEDRERQLTRQVTALRGRLPGPEGGSITADEARVRAERDADALMELARQARGIDNPSLWMRVREAENTLHRSQFLLARADNAKTVYRIRPGDTLELLGLMFYDDTNAWPRIFDNNRHVLPEPSPLLPGLTLVIP